MPRNSRILRPTTEEVEAVRLRTEKARLAKLGGRVDSKEEMARHLDHDQWFQQHPAPTAEEKQDFMNRTENKAHEIVMTAALEVLQQYRDAKETSGAKPHHVIAALQLTDSVAAERAAFIAEYGHPHQKDTK